MKEHLERVKAQDFDNGEFIEKVMQSASNISNEYSAFITMAKDKPNGILPISVKDNICTKGIRTTAGSKILDTYVPPFDATAVSKAKASGGFVIGKTAMDEFGFGTFSTNCAYGAPKNPHNKERVCGGSSGGAACVAYAADFPHIAIAQSTGGSITAPAAFTGTVGLTPTYGLVSRWGLIDYANSMDRIGVIGKCSYDAALGLSIISGYDPLDSTSMNRGATDYVKSIGNDVKGMKIGVPKEYFDGVDKDITENVWKSIKLLESMGATYEEFSLKLTKYATPAYYIIALSEASTNLAKFCGIRYGIEKQISGNYDEYFSAIRELGFGTEAKRRIILGTYARMSGYRDAYYIRALKIRGKIISEFKAAFKRYDSIATPSMPILPPKFSEINSLTPAQTYSMDRLTTAPNLCGFPTISVPAGTINGLPSGIQLIADHLNENKLVALASACE